MERVEGFMLKLQLACLKCVFLKFGFGTPEGEPGITPPSPIGRLSRATSSSWSKLPGKSNSNLIFVSSVLVSRRE
jgi:hypothetical protein